MSSLYISCSNKCFPGKWKTIIQILQNIGQRKISIMLSFRVIDHITAVSFLVDTTLTRQH